MRLAASGSQAFANRCHTFPLSVPHGGRVAEALCAPVFCRSVVAFVHIRTQAAGAEECAPAVLRRTPILGPILHPSSLCISVQGTKSLGSLRSPRAPAFRAGPLPGGDGQDGDRERARECPPSPSS